MTANWLLNPFSSADALSEIMVVCSALFAAAMTASRGRIDRVSFMTYFFEGVTILSSVIILISVFSRKLFEQIGDNKTFLMIVALMTLSYGVRDVFGRLNRVSTDVGRQPVERENLK